MPAGRMWFRVHIFANQRLHNNTERIKKEVWGGIRVKINIASYLYLVRKFPKKMSVLDHWFFLNIFSPIACFSLLL